MRAWRSCFPVEGNDLIDLLSLSKIKEISFARESSEFVSREREVRFIEFFQKTRVLLMVECGYFLSMNKARAVFNRGL